MSYYQKQLKQWEIRRARIRDLRAAGHTLEDIAKRMGVSKQAVSKTLQKMGEADK